MEFALQNTYNSLASASDYILKILSEVIGVNTLFIAVNDGHSNFILKSLNRTRTLVESGSTLPLYESYCGIVTQSDDVVLIPNTKKSNQTCHLKVTSELGNASFVGVPITLPDNTVCGTICGLDPDGYQYSEKDVNLLKTMAKFLSFMVELESIAFRDPLTQAFNRNFINLFLSDDWQERFHTIAFLFIDLDDFKRYNDEYNHTFGDEILQETTHRIQRCLSERDTVCRVGGDEFVALIPNYETVETLTNLMDNLLTEFANPMYIQNERIFVSASIGISLYPHDGEEIEQLMMRADTAMYHVKQSGKGKYQLFGGTPNIH